MRILLFTLLLAGGLPVCSQQPTAVQPDPQAVEPLVGTLEIEAAAVDSINYGDSRPLPFAGWIMINGELRGRMPLTQRFMLAPGSYEVRAVVAARNGYGVQFLAVRWPGVTVQQGRTVTVKAFEAIRDFPRYVSADDETRGATPVPDAGGPIFEINDRNLAYLEKTAATDMQAAWQRYLKDSVFKGVLEATARVDKTPPSRPRVWIDVPWMYGGPREFDIEQLRILQEAIQPNIGGWGTSIPFFPKTVTDNQREFAAGRMAQLKAQNAIYVAEVARIFDALVAELEKARDRRP